MAVRDNLKSLKDLHRPDCSIAGRGGHYYLLYAQFFGATPGNLERGLGSFSARMLKVDSFLFHF